MNRFSPGHILVAILAVLCVSLDFAKAQEPLPVGPMEAPARSLFLKVVKHYESRTVDEYDEHTRDPQELRERAREFIRTAKLAEQGETVEWSRQKFYDVGRGLIADGSRDPLVIALAMQTTINLREEDHEQIVALCTQAIEDVVEIYEPRQQVDVIRYCQHVEFGLSQTLWQMRREKATKYDFERTDTQLLDDAFVRWMEAEAGSLERQRYIWHLST